MSFERVGARGGDASGAGTGEASPAGKIGARTLTQALGTGGHAAAAPAPGGGAAGGPDARAGTGTDIRQLFGAPGAPGAPGGNDAPPGAAGALSEMGGAFGRSFDGVRLHAGPEAAGKTASLGTKAVTTGRDVYFAEGAFAPGSSEGKRVLAHELTHVVQQEQVATGPQGFTDAPVGERGNAFEREAHRAADDVAAGRRPQIDLRASAATAMRDEEPPATLDQRAYLAKYADQIATGVIARMSEIDLATDSPFATWKGDGKAVIGAVSTAVAGNHTGFVANLPTLCAPESPVEAIDRGRDAVEGKSDDEWKPAVASELRNLLARRLRESIKRLMPKYAHATNAEYARHLGPVAKDPADLDNPPDPLAADITPSAPIDKHVIPALIGKVKVDLRNYQAAHPNEKPPQPARKVDYAFEATERSSKSEGKHCWVRVTTVCDPPVTAEDVALSIFGGPEFASFVVGAPPLFGFSRPDLLVRYEEWKKLPGNDGSADPGSDKHDPATADPAKQILASQDADQAALNQAAGAKGTDKSDKAAVVKRIQAAGLVVDGMVKAATSIGGLPVGELTGLKSRLDNRIKTIEGAAENASGGNAWDAQSAQQLEIVGSASNGLETAQSNWAALKAGGDGKESPASFVADPIRRLATAYIDAAAVSDLIDTGRQRLASAAGVLRAYPIDVLEGLLSYVRQLVAGATKSHGSMGEINAQTSVTTLGKKEEELRTRLSALRDTLASNPNAAAVELKKIQQEVQSLQDDATVLALLSRSNELDNLMLNLHSTLGTRAWNKLNPANPDKRSKNQMYDDAQSDLTSFENALKLKVVAPARAGDTKKAHDGLIAVQAEYRGIFDRIGKLIEDQESREKWIKVGVMIGVGVLSAGFADAVVAVGVAELELEGAAVTALKVGTEAATFTALTTLTLEKDPTIAGMIGEFVKNAATFGMVHKAMAAYKAALPGFAETLAGKGTAISGMFIAHCSAGLIAADAKRYLETGKHLSEEEAKGSILEGVLVTIGTLIGERVTHHLLASVHLTTPRLKSELDAINSERGKTAAGAAKLKAPGATADQAKAVISGDGQTIAKEQKLLEELDDIDKDPAKAKASGVSDPDIAAIKGAKGDRAAASADAEQGELLQLTASLKPVGSGVFSAEGTGKFDAIVGKHPKENVTLSGEPGKRTAEIKVGDQTIRIIEDAEGAVSAKSEPKPVDPNEAAGTAAAIEARAREKEYTDQKSALLGSLKKVGENYEVDGSGPTLADVCQRMRALGWQTMEIVETGDAALPDGTKAKLRTARFEAHPDPASGKPPYETGVQVATVTETKPFDPKSAPPIDKARYEAAIHAIHSRQVPNPVDLPGGAGNLEGTVKLEKVNRDAWLNGDPEGQTLLAEFYRMLSAKLKAYEDPTKAQLSDLNGLLQEVMNAKGSDGKPLFLNKGPAITKAEAQTFGGFYRGVSFDALAGNKCITQAYYDRLVALPDNDPAWKLPKNVADISYGAHAENIGKLMAKLPPDVNADLVGGAPIGRGGAPGWWGSGSDPGIADPPPATLDAQAYAKAVAAANLKNGGVLFRLDADQVTGGGTDAQGAKTVARRPTTFDALWQNQFNPNPEAGAAFGKTTPDPHDTAVKPVREVIMSTVNISESHTRILLK